MDTTQKIPRYEAPDGTRLALLHDPVKYADCAVCSALLDTMRQLSAPSLAALSARTLEDGRGVVAWTAAELAAYTGRARSTARMHLNTLMVAGQVLRADLSGRGPFAAKAFMLPPGQPAQQVDYAAIASGVEAGDGPQDDPFAASPDGAAVPGDDLESGLRQLLLGQAQQVSPGPHLSAKWCITSDPRTELAAVSFSADGDESFAAAKDYAGRFSARWDPGRRHWVLPAHAGARLAEELKSGGADLLLGEGTVPDPAPPVMSADDTRKVFGAVRQLRDMVKELREAVRELEEDKAAVWSRLAKLQEQADVPGTAQLTEEQMKHVRMLAVSAARGQCDLWRVEQREAEERADLTARLAEAGLAGAELDSAVEAALKVRHPVIAFEDLFDTRDPAGNGHRGVRPAGD